MSYNRLGECTRSTASVHTRPRKHPVTTLCLLSFVSLPSYLTDQLPYRNTNSAVQTTRAATTTRSRWIHDEEMGARPLPDSRSEATNSKIDIPPPRRRASWRFPWDPTQQLRPVTACPYNQVYVGCTA